MLSTKNCEFGVLQKVLFLVSRSVLKHTTVITLNSVIFIFIIPLVNVALKTYDHILAFIFILFLLSEHLLMSEKTFPTPQWNEVFMKFYLFLCHHPIQRSRVESKLLGETSTLVTLFIFLPFCCYQCILLLVSYCDIFM